MPKLLPWHHKAETRNPNGTRCTPCCSILQQYCSKRVNRAYLFITCELPSPPLAALFKKSPQHMFADVLCWHLISTGIGMQTHPRAQAHFSAQRINASRHQPSLSTDCDTHTEQKRVPHTHTLTAPKTAASATISPVVRCPSNVAITALA